jgi:serine/threonine protein kinase
MGQVYRACDSKLGHDVALKILPHAVAQDPDRIARFNSRLTANRQDPVKHFCRSVAFPCVTGICR